MVFVNSLLVLRLEFARDLDGTAGSSNVKTPFTEFGLVSCSQNPDTAGCMNLLKRN